MRSRHLETLTRASTPIVVQIEAQETRIHQITHSGSILSLALSSRYIFAGTQANVINVWDVDTYASVALLSGHNGSILSLFLSEDESLLFSSGTDSIVRIWDVASLKCLYVVYSTYDIGDVFSVVYSDTFQTLYLGSQNTAIQWLEMSSINKRPTPDLATYPTQRPNKFFDSTGPGGRGHPISRLAPVDNSNILVEIGKEDIIQYAHYSYVLALVLGKYQGLTVLFSGGGDSAINIWKLSPEPVQIRSLCHDSQDDSVLTLVQNETLLYAGHRGGFISIWDLETNQSLRRLGAHSGFNILTLSVTSACLFSGADNGVIKKWNLEKGFECISEFQAHKGPVLCSKVRQGRNSNPKLATGGNDYLVAIWDLGKTFQANGTNEQPEDLMRGALSKLVSLPSVSNSEAHVEACRRAATFLKNLTHEFGAIDSQLVPTISYNPIVLAKFKANRTAVEPVRNVLFYGHYDVISADEGAWQSNPWHMEGRDGYLYGRGLSDNKGPVLAAIFAVHELLQAKELAVDVTFVIEGEEESGSRGFIEAVRTVKLIIGNVDEVFLSNSYWLDDSLPCLTYGLRGVIHAQVSVSSSNPDLHSGVQGGSVREPTIELINLLAKLTNDNGTIQLPKFHDSVRQIEGEEKAFFEDIAKYQKGTEIADVGVVQELMARWCKPSITIHRVDVSGPGNSTVIPHRASAKISLRIVPDQCLNIIISDLTEYLEQCFQTLKSCNKLVIEVDHCADWWLGVPSSKPFKTLERLISEEWALPTRPLYIREGGSIPAVRWLEKEFGAPAVHFPMGQASDQAHLNDERMRLSNLEKGRDILKRYFGSS